MRLRATITSVVAATLLVVAFPGSALAMNPADEVFQPLGQEEPAKPAKSAKPAPAPAEVDAEVVNAEDVNSEASADAGAPEGDAPVSDREREAAHARGSRMAVDLMGWMPSLYTGKWFMPGKEGVRKCILDRESNFNYRSTNGTYHGAYQMSAALARGATWMMQGEVRREMGAEGVEIVKALRKLTPNKWNRYWQDRAFWTVWRNGSGARHWHGGC